MHRILIVDDEKGIREFLLITLKKEGYDVTLASSGDEAVEICRNEVFDVILVDIKMPHGDGYSVLREVKSTSPETVVIMITAYGSLESAVQAMREGAFDYISKPFNVGELKALLKTALRKRELEQQSVHQQQGQESNSFDNIIGIGTEMKKLFAIIPRSAATRSNVLIIGESGTGKELVARAIHRHSNRKDKPFIPINCGGIPENLLESELFGHRKGSFTGAHTTKKGLFEAASEGTIFLDEIGDLPLALQVKLLRVVQEKAFTPVGDTQEVNVDVRIISATNQDLEKKVIEGRFREDLYYRLNVIQLRIPPLRERKEDIGLLAQYFLEKYSREMDKEIKQISTYAMDALKNYHFPGNVRELENVIERALIFSQGAVTPDLLELGGKEGLEHGGQISPLPEVAARAVEQAETGAIRRVLAQCKGNKSKAAKILGVSYKTLLNKIKEYEISAQ